MRRPVTPARGSCARGKPLWAPTSCWSCAPALAAVEKGHKSDIRRRRKASSPPVQRGRHVSARRVCKRTRSTQVPRATSTVFFVKVQVGAARAGPNRTRIGNGGHKAVCTRVRESARAGGARSLEHNVEQAKQRHHAAKHATEQVVLHHQHGATGKVAMSLANGARTPYKMNKMPLPSHLE